MAEPAPQIRVGLLPYRIHYKRQDASDAYEFLPADGAATFTEDEFVRLLHSQLVRRPNEEALVVFNLSGRKDGWKTARRWVNAGDNIKYYIASGLYDEVNEHDGGPLAGEVPLGTLGGAIVYFRHRGAPAGGCHPSDLSGRNDCLWRAIATAYGGPDRMPKVISTDKKLRKLVGVAYGELIPGDVIPQIEDAIKTAAIVCSGAFTYDSGESRRRDRTINLELADSHYYLRTTGETVDEFLDFKHKFKPPHVYIRRGETVDIYRQTDPLDPTTTTCETIDAAKFSEVLYHKFDYPAWLIRCENGRTPAETIQNWWKQQSDLRHAGIDMAKYGKFTNACIALHRLICRTIPRSDPVNGVEHDIMKAAFHSGLMWGRDDWSGPAVYLDVNAYYASLMISKAMFPIRSGTLATISSFNHKFGYYYAIISGVPPAFFRGNTNGPAWHTHTDLDLVIRLGGSVELVQQAGTPNAYIYERDALRTLNALYGGYVDRLFKLKLEGNRTAKQALTAIWGLHCAKSRRETVAQPDEDVYIDGDVIAIAPGEKTILITSTDPDLPYIGEHPRVGPFLTAYGRMKMAVMLKPHAERLVSVLCDGFALSGDEIPADLAAKVGTGIGELKIENRGTVHVNGCAVRWE